MVGDLNKTTYDRLYKYWCVHITVLSTTLEQELTQQQLKIRDPCYDLMIIISVKNRSSHFSHWLAPWDRGMEVAQAVPYKVEGGKGIPHEIEPDEKVIDDVFDLSYTDYHFFQEKFLDKGACRFFISLRTT